MKAVTCNRRLDKVATCRSCLPIHRLRRESRERHQLQQGDPSVWKLVEKNCSCMKSFCHRCLLVQICGEIVVISVPLVQYVGEFLCLEVLK